MKIWLDAVNAPLPVFNAERARLALENVDLQEPKLQKLLQSALSHSDYLARIIRTEPQIAQEIFAQTPETVFNKICQAAQAAGDQTEPSLIMQTLRKLKKRSAFLIALADIAGVWNLEQVMAANTKFADACVQAAIRHIAQNMHGIKPDVAQAGIVLIAMGKYGAHELNYSSDIDVIMFYDPDACHDPALASKIFPKAARQFVHIMQSATQEGYVFRTDLSLRPDPGTSQAATALPSAQQYYESLGQNWERAAFIKARWVAGNQKLGLAFLESMQPFIWRKYLDYAVLEDIHAMKRQAHAASTSKQHDTDQHVAGLSQRDIKRSSGGIRDIEMFVQSQQLIAGGRDRFLRRRQTCVMLARLAARQWISKQTARELIQAYRFLRHVEHRLQMIYDEQTHKLPHHSKDWEQLSSFCGFDDLQTFKQTLLEKINLVRVHDSQLFSQSPALGSKTGALVFTGGEDDPETLHNLRTMGFAQAETITKTIRRWHVGAMPATRSQRARESLTALIPYLLECLAKTANPDATFLRVDKFLQRLSAGVQFFALLQSNPALVRLITLICGAAPRLAYDLASHPRMIEAMLNPLNPLNPQPENLKHDLDLEIGRLQDYEAILDAVRIWTREQQFLIGVRILEKNIHSVDIAQQFSTIAETALCALQDKVEREFAKTYGNVKNAELAVLAAGSLGAKEMTIQSDLDMVLIYQCDDDAVSDGPKQLPARVYFTRLAQKFVHALTVQTTQSKLYQVDMRLRPSGHSGPVATSLKMFDDYQHHHAWLWEHMALTRMRPISGSSALRQKIQAIIRDVLCKQRDDLKLKNHVLEMHKKIHQARPNQGFWDVSDQIGGIVDAEFISQYLRLKYAAQYPEILSTGTISAFELISKAGLANLEPLTQTVIFLKQILQPLRLCLGQIEDEHEMPTILRNLLVESTQSKNFAALKAQCAECYRVIGQCFKQYIGEA